MASRTPPRDEPNEERDVIVQLIRVLDALSYEEQSNPWSVFVGIERMHNCSTREEAEASARAGAQPRGAGMDIGREWSANEAHRFVMKRRGDKEVLPWTPSAAFPCPGRS